MTNDQINEAVARKLGWTKCEHDSLEDGEFTCAVGWVRPNPIKPCFHERLPNYCGEIGAAWEIIEYLQKKELIFVIQIGGYLNNPCACGSFEKYEYGCRISDVASHLIGPFSVGVSAPEAICKAFLKLGEK